MSSKVDAEIRKQLGRYLSGEVSLRQFRHWFDEKTWPIDATSDSPELKLAGEIELRLAEYSNGHRSEEELRCLLRPLAGAFLRRSENQRESVEARPARNLKH